MTWLRVESRLPGHPKVHKAGAQLGRGGRGRVLAIWLVGSTFAVDQLTDGFVPVGVMEDERYDRKPEEVIAAMLAVKLIHAEPGGYRLHDFHHYNPSAQSILAKRKADLERKSRHGKPADSTQIPRGIAAESPRNPSGFQTDSNALAGARGRARSESESEPQDQEPEDPRALRARFPQGADAPNVRVLTALVHTILDEQPDIDGVDLVEETKTRASNAPLLYDGRSVTKAIESALEQRRRRRA